MACPHHILHGADKMFPVFRPPRIRRAHRSEHGLVFRYRASIGPGEQFGSEANIESFVHPERCDRIVSGIDIEEGEWRAVVEEQGQVCTQTTGALVAIFEGLQICAGQPYEECYFDATCDQPRL